MSLSNKLVGELIGLDLGIARTGVARIHTYARIAEALQPIDMRQSDLLDQVKKLISELEACAVIVGLPRGLDGQQTEQTRWAETIIAHLDQELSVPVYAIDEAGTTKQAEQDVHKGQSVDSVAAGILLEDFLNEVERGNIANVSL